MKLYGPVPSLIYILVGAGGCMASLLMYAYMPCIMDFVISQMMVINTNSIVFPIWRDVPIDIYSKYYLYNYTNHEEFLQNWTNGVKPKVQEVGPYTFRTYHKKTILRWNEGDDTVDYYDTVTFKFTPEKTKGSLNDTIILPNLPLLVILQVAPEEYLPGLKGAIEMTETTKFVQKSVGALLFDGYKDALVDLLQELSGIEYLPGAMFGLLYGKNGSNDGNFKMKRGNKNNSEFGHIVQWNNISKLDVWSGSPCNDIIGTDGTLHKHSITKTDVLKFFVAEGCRTLYIKFLKETQYKSLKTYRFSNDMSLFADVGLNPDNKCYCNEEAAENCSPSGVFHIGPCKEGAPLYLSYPHFFMADRKLRYAIDGLQPDEEKHRLYMDIEPTGGAIMQAAVRIQANIMVKPAAVEGMEDLPTILLPIMWFEMSAEISEELYNYFGTLLVVGINLSAIGPWFAFAIFIIMLAVGVTFSITLVFDMNKSRVQPLDDDNTSFVKTTSRAFFVKEYDS